MSAGVPPADDTAPMWAPRCECGHYDADHHPNPETGWGECERQGCGCAGFQQAADDVAGGVPVAGDLEEAERAARECDEAGVPLTWRSLNVLLAEYDRRGTELARLRDGEAWTHGYGPDPEREALEQRDAALQRVEVLSSLLRGMARRVGVLRGNGRHITEAVDGMQRRLDTALNERDELQAQLSELDKLRRNHDALADAYVATREALDHTRARVAAVRALANEWDAANEPAGESLRAVLDGSTDTPREPDGDELLLVRKPGRMSGRPTVGHSRLPLLTLLEFLRAGDSPELVQSAYPSVTAEQMRVIAALRADLDDRDPDEESPVSPREDETPEPAPTRKPEGDDLCRQVTEYMREAHRAGDDVATAWRDAGEIFMIDAGSVSTTPDPAARPLDCGEQTQVWAPCPGCRQAADGQPCACAGGWCCERHRVVAALDEAFIAQGGELLDGDVSEVAADTAVRFLMASPDLLAALAGTATPEPEHTKGRASVSHNMNPPLAPLPRTLRSTAEDTALLGTWADPEFRAHQDHRHPVEGCGYCPPEDET